MSGYSLPLQGKTILITGSARRIGRYLALTAAQNGANVIIHHGHSQVEAEETAREISALGRETRILPADLADSSQADRLVAQAFEWKPVDILVNSAAIFANLGIMDTTIDAWNQHLSINLTAPFLLSQAFRRYLSQGAPGRILNILDWRALRPGADHFPYTISKAALAALTRALAVGLAPDITVNGLALGAILPPSTGQASDRIIERVPARRWADLKEVGDAFLFLVSGPAYITGEILHLDGGRHLD